MEKDLEKININSNASIYWNSIVESCTNISENLKPNTDKKIRFKNDRICQLSNQQKDLRLEIGKCKDLNRRKELKVKRNKVINEQHKLVNKEYEKKLETEIEDIENSKNDSNRMFKAIKIINKKNNNKPLIIKKDDNIIGNIEEKIKEISIHFEKTFNCNNPSDLPKIEPQPLKNVFTEKEVEIAVKSLKNNTSSGCDGIKTENIKYAPSTFKHIANILNKIAETGEYPTEIKSGLLTPLQKPGKEKGPVTNLRPVILLSILRKILAICVIRRIRGKIDEYILPISQTAYSTGRSTAELVFAFKVLAEKAISSCDYEINLLMLDMSKAFDTIQRGTLIKDLKGIIEDDELHLIVLLLDKVNYSVKLEGEIGNPFITNIGAPQGDGASALFFIIYLALSLLIYTNKQHNKQDHLYCKSYNSESRCKPEHLIDHTYYHDINKKCFTIDQQYADDIGWASTGIHIINNIEKEIPKTLKSRNLFVNEAKTEKFNIKRLGSENWKKCKYVGSLLNTEDDIKRRIGLTCGAYNNLKTIFQSKKINVNLKIRIFKALLESVFLI